MPLMELGSTQDDILSLQLQIHDIYTALATGLSEASLRAAGNNDQMIYNIRKPLVDKVHALEAQLTQLQSTAAASSPLTPPPLTPPNINLSPEANPYSKYIMYGVLAVGAFIGYKYFVRKPA